MADERRRRILLATEELVGEYGYLGLRIEQLLSRAKVSLPTVRKHFGDKDGCFRALVEDTVEEARNALREAFAAEEGPWAERVAAALAALLALIASDPTRARAWLVEPFAAGAAAIAWQEPVLEELRAILAEGQQANAAAKTTREMLASAVLWSASEPLIAGEAERIAGLLDELMELAQGAFLDPGAASGSARRRSADRSRTAATGTRASSRTSEERASLDPLPAGRHGLSREQVRASQRERLLAAVAEVVGERGFAGARLTDIVAAAAVSRRVFYENFEDKEECFLAALDAIGDHLRELSEVAECREGDWHGRAVAALEAVLGFFVAEPGLTRLCMVEPFAAGEAAREKYRQAIASVAAEMKSARAWAGAEVSLPAGTEELLAGAAAWGLSRRIALEGSGDLPSLLPSPVEWLLSPYLGYADAERIGHEMETRGREL